MAEVAPVLERRIGAVLGWLARGLALFGGVILAAVAVMTVASITGRALIFAGFGPVKGDFELVQLGAAIAVFSFLPWCQLQRGHVTVDILADRLGPRIKSALGLLGNAAIALVALIVARMLWLGMLEKFCFSPQDPAIGWLWEVLSIAEPFCWVEATYELGLPAWWGYALGSLGAWLFAIVALYTVWRSLNETMRGEAP
ncbi:MAG: TRAP transporter small permease [Pseudomonadota bacterium]